MGFNSKLTGDYIDIGSYDNEEAAYYTAEQLYIGASFAKASSSCIDYSKLSTPANPANNLVSSRIVGGPMFVKEVFKEKIIEDFNNEKQFRGKYYRSLPVQELYDSALADLDKENAFYEELLRQKLQLSKENNELKVQNRDLKMKNKSLKKENLSLQKDVDIHKKDLAECKTQLDQKNRVVEAAMDMCAKQKAYTNAIEEVHIAIQEIGDEANE